MKKNKLTSLLGIIFSLVLIQCTNNQSDISTSADLKTTECNICKNDITILNSLNPENEVVQVSDDVSEIYLENIKDYYLVKNKNRNNKISTRTPDWSRTTFIEFEDGKKLFSTPISENIKAKDAGNGNYKTDREILYTQFGDSVNSQFIYKVQTDITEELLNKDDDMALSKPVKISYYSINGKNLTSINTSGSELINAFNNSKTVFKDEERCVSDSWGECVKDNLTKAGGAELLVCMAMGKWCAGGLAAMCTVDVQFEIARPIYCD